MSTSARQNRTFPPFIFDDQGYSFTNGQSIPVPFESAVSLKRSSPFFVNYNLDNKERNISEIECLKIVSTKLEKVGMGMSF